ncbi:MAG: hypothetical protein MJH09_05765 [Cetobacterium sp.]|nr:hypothetical protein [Cetobacterium sp.]
MKNIELKGIYWTSSEAKRKEIKKTLLQREHTKYRVNMANYDILVSVIEPINEYDEKVCVVINGVFTMSELEERCIYLPIKAHSIH